MTKVMQLVCVSALAGLAFSAAVWAGEPVKSEDMSTVMTPGKGLSLDVGGKHAVGYFQTEAEACALTVVLADVAGGESGADSPGTRIVASVAPGRALRVDAAKDKSAEFLCGPGGKKMNARVIDRPSYRDVRS